MRGQKQNDSIRFGLVIIYIFGEDKLEDTPLEISFVDKFRLLLCSQSCTGRRCYSAETSQDLNTLELLSMSPP